MGIMTSIFRFIWGESEDQSVVDPKTGLTLREKELLSESWKALGSKKDQKKFGVDFFIQLFETYPELQGKFPVFKGKRLSDLQISPSMRAHSTTVMYSIGSMVGNLDDPDCLIGLIEKLAVNHQVREMFGAFLEIQLCTEASPEVKTAWDKFFGLMTSVIKKTQESAEYRESE